MSKKSPVSRSGRFAGGPAADVALFTESISFDWRLWKHDILGSLAHAAMLHKIGVLTRKELVAITRGLDAIGKEIKAGKFKWKPELEDVHMNIESELTKRVPAGAKLHTARSRNDQVALDVRLWLRDEITGLLREIADLQRALVSLGERNADVIIPGYTHMQRAQPVYIAHHLLAYVEMLERDCERLWDCHSRVNVCPLGSGAIAGSTLPLKRELVAKLLGFVNDGGEVQVTQNSMDGVSDRDFMIEFAAAAALLAVHFSRLSEDLILWAGTEFNFIKIADAYTTGSSLMPQKKNPDIRGAGAGQDGSRGGQPDEAADVIEGFADDLQSRPARGQGTRVRHGGHRARDNAAAGRDVAEHEDQQAGLRGSGERPGLAGHGSGGLPGAEGHALPAGASCRRRGGGAGGKDGQAAELAEARGLAVGGARRKFKRDALGVFNLEDGDGEAEHHGGAGNERGGGAVGEVAGEVVVNLL